MPQRDFIILTDAVPAGAEINVADLGPVGIEQTCTFCGKIMVRVEPAEVDDPNVTLPVFSIAMRVQAMRHGTEQPREQLEATIAVDACRDCGPAVLAPVIRQLADAGIDLIALADHADHIAADEAAAFADGVKAATGA